jgi:putative RecB family exonuclease
MTTATHPDPTTGRPAAVDAAGLGSELPELEVPEVLSPSRMSDYVKCPKAFFFRSILRLPTVPTIQQVRGTLTHTVLERLFDLRPHERTVDAAVGLLPQAWADQLVDSPRDALAVAVDGSDPATSGDDATIPVDDDKVAAMFDQCRTFVRNYFTMETPAGFTPEGRELDVRAGVGDHQFRGVIDRLDRMVGSDGRTRVFISDYKTGTQPAPQWADKAFFAMRVYAVLLAEARQVTVDRLRLLFLSQTTKAAILASPVSSAVLRATRNQITRIAGDIDRSFERDNWPTRPSRLCDWCDFRPVCPAHHTSVPDVVELRARTSR